MGQEAIRQVMARYQEKKQAFSIVTEVQTEPAFLQEMLKQHGLNKLATLLGMTIDLSRVMRSDPPKELALYTLQETQELRGLVNTAGEVFAMPQEAIDGYLRLLQSRGCTDAFTHIAGTKEGKIVATGTLLCTEKGAFIYNVTTIEGERRKGYAGAVCSALLDHAKRHNKAQCALIASPMGVSTYKRLGFHETERFHFYG